MTRQRKRDRLKVPATIPCGFCPEKFSNFDDLRFHAQADHNRAFYQINRSLATIDAKLRVFERLAEEGMRGYKSDAGLGVKVNPERIEILVENVESKAA